jgi:flagellar biosynthetic protein FlhB
MSSQRTEPATPRRRQEARRRGQVARSADLTQAAALLAATAAATATASWAAGGFVAYAQRALEAPRMDRPGLALLEGLEAGARVLAPAVLAALAVAVVVGVAQTGGLFTAKPLEPQLDRLNPLRALERLFSLRSAAELLKAALKLAAVVAAVWAPLRQVVADPGPLAPSAAELVVQVGTVLRDVAWRGGLALGVLGVLDYLYQRFEYERGLRMTRQEVREDLRETEGDPLVRARQRARQRELARRRMLREVARATVVVTNPTHLAVALRYAPPHTPAPVVVAKGAGSVAERIREAARRHGVPTVPNPPLAQALYRRVPLGGAIPPALYRAVAEILALLYRAGRLREVPL